MGRGQRIPKELEDKVDKVRNARASAQRPRATEREKADLKLLVVRTDMPSILLGM